MKRLIAVLLAGAIMAGTFHVDELIRMRVVFSHYAIPNPATDDGTLIGYLVVHMFPGNSETDNTDGMNHPRLPVKSAKIPADHFSTAVLLERPSSVNTCSVSELIFIYESRATMTGCFGIFHPPRV